MTRRRRRYRGLAAYEHWILRALNDNGGSDKVPHVYEVVLGKMRDQFGPREMETVRTDGSGQPVWKNETRWARLNLIEDGRMEPSQIHGIWKISEKGKVWLKENPTAPCLSGPGSVDDLSDMN